MWIRGPQPPQRNYGSIVTYASVTVQMDDRDAIRKTFIFKDFTEAWGFMSRTALVAEKVNYLHCQAYESDATGRITEGSLEKSWVWQTGWGD
jgi:4a-hydroxytetrahydrobiopterin dehydratase